MATQGPYTTISLNATGDLSSYQYYVVQLASTAGECKLATSATSKTVGVLMNEPTGGQTAEVAIFGIVKVAGEASVTVGGAVCSSSTGRAKLTTTGGDRMLGYAMDAVSSAGDIIRILLVPGVNGD